VSDRPKNLAKSRIEKLDRVLARDPDAFAARFERAGLHREQGAYEAAKADYLELLRRRPTDFGVLNDFGNLVLKAGYKDAARSLFSEAVRHHPDNPMGRVIWQRCCSCSTSSAKRARISKRPSAPIPTTFMPIAAWAICWPRSATRRARGRIAIGASRAIS